MDNYEDWAVIDLAIQFDADIVYPLCRLDVPITFDDVGLPTEEEKVQGWALRRINISPERAWTYSVCLECELPLPLHPEGRRERVRGAYCREARKRAT